MNQIGIGVIGGGGIAAEGHIRGYQTAPRCVVQALWDVDEAKVEEQAQRLGVPSVSASLDELLGRDDIQAVSVCSPDHTHGELCHKARQAGKHVLCEKCWKWNGPISPTFPTIPCPTATACTGTNRGTKPIGWLFKTRPKPICPSRPNFSSSNTAVILICCISDFSLCAPPPARQSPPPRPGSPSTARPARWDAFIG